MRRSTGTSTDVHSLQEDIVLTEHAARRHEPAAQNAVIVLTVGTKMHPDAAEGLAKWEARPSVPRTIS